MQTLRIYLNMKTAILAIMQMSLLLDTKYLTYDKSVLVSDMNSMTMEYGLGILPWEGQLYCTEVIG